MMNGVVDKDKTYIHENKEVKLTGRKAKKEIKKEGRVSKEDILYEIRPVESPTLWNAWIRIRDLYEIEEY